MLNRAYSVPVPWPFESFPLVMEFAPGTCDLYEQTASFSTSVCCRVASGDPDEDTPEAHVREAIASVLAGCHRRRCNVVDLYATSN